MAMNFKPSGAGMSDIWCVSWKGQAHAFYLAVRPPRAGESPYVNGICHAVSDDLLNWKELPSAVLPNAPGEPGDIDPWSGCCVAKDDGLYLFYTARSSREKGKVQSIYLAVSRDGIHFENYRHNPVFTPDPKLYYHAGNPSVTGEVDCRDFSIVWD